MPEIPLSLLQTSTYILVQTHSCCPMILQNEVIKCSPTYQKSVSPNALTILSYQKSFKFVASLTRPLQTRYFWPKMSKCLGTRWKLLILGLFLQNPPILSCSRFLRAGLHTIGPRSKQWCKALNCYRHEECCILHTICSISQLSNLPVVRTRYCNKRIGFYLVWEITCPAKTFDCRGGDEKHLSENNTPV